MSVTKRLSVTAAQIDAAVSGYPQHSANSQIHTTAAEKQKLAALENYDDTAVRALIAQKQDALTFDTAPTSMSTNPVTSGGVFSALWSLTDIESGTDLATLTDLGIYRCRTGTITDTLSHCPITGGSGFRLVVNRTSHTTKFYQLLMPASVTDANIYLRKYDGSWGSWFRFAGQEVT